MAQIKLTGTPCVDDPVAGVNISPSQLFEGWAWVTVVYKDEEGRGRSFRVKYSTLLDFARAIQNEYSASAFSPDDVSKVEVV